MDLKKGQLYIPESGDLSLITGIERLQLLEGSENKDEYLEVIEDQHNPLVRIGQPQVNFIRTKYRFRRRVIVLSAWEFEDSTVTTI